MQRGSSVLFVRARALPARAVATKNASYKIQFSGPVRLGREATRSLFDSNQSKSNITLKLVGSCSLSQRRSYSSAPPPPQEDRERSNQPKPDEEPQQSTNPNGEPGPFVRKEFKIGAFKWQGNWSELSLVSKTGVLLVVALIGFGIVLFFALAMAQSISIYSLYNVQRGDHWIKYLAFFPYLQWFPALELAEMPREWGLAALGVGLLRESAKKSSNAMLKPPALRAASALLTLTFYLMMFYRNSQIVRHVDGDDVTSLGLLISFTAPIFWPLLAFQADSFGKTPAFTLEQKLASTPAIVDPAERIRLENELVLARVSAPNVFDFMRNGMRNLREAVAYKKDVSRNPALRWSAEAARWFGFH